MEEALNQAKKLIAAIQQELVRRGYKGKPGEVSIHEDEVCVEWIEQDRRIGFAIDETQTSSWFVVTNRGGFSDSGSLENLPLAHLCKTFFSQKP